MAKKRAVIDRLHINNKEVYRFIIVGIFATLIHYGVYWLLNKWINTKVAYSIGYVTSFLCNFILSNRYTFRTNPTLTKGFKFALSHLLNYTIQMLLMNIYLIVGVHYSIAPILTWMISIPINFLLVKQALK